VTLPVFWTHEANQDLLDARAWYDNVRPELGERFALAVETTVGAFADHPLQFPVIYQNRRRAGVRRFPYGIFFEAQDNRIVVIACFHGRRNPRGWQSR
jgi:plasmid stabilization system protein ParE